MKTKVCMACEEELLESVFGSNGDYNGIPRLKPRCKTCNNTLELAIFEEKLFRAIGGKENFKCMLCGYDRYAGALEFHHINPNEKEREISKMKNYSYKKIKEEVTLQNCVNDISMLKTDMQEIKNLLTKMSEN